MAVKMVGDILSLMKGVNKTNVSKNAPLTFTVNVAQGKAEKLFVPKRNERRNRKEEPMTPPIPIATYNFNMEIPFKQFGMLGISHTLQIYAHQSYI